eukprot:33628-Eustigmatos_ZCMA.PRE.1
MALLKRDLRLAEDILMAQGRTKETVDMAYSRDDVEQMKSEYYRRLLATGQEERAGAMKEGE